MSTRFFNRPTSTYAGEVGLTNRTKYQDDSSASPRVPISSAKIDGDINYVIDAVNTLYDTAVSGVVADNSVTDAKLRDSSGLSVIGRSANSTGNPGDIVAANDGEVLRRSGTSLGFGTVGTSGITDNSITTSKILDTNVSFAKIQNVNTATVLGRSTSGAGSVEALTLGSNLSIAGGVLSGPGTATTSTAGVVQLRNGEVIQTAYTNTSTTFDTTATSIPADSTIPQNTEGTEILTLSITPTNSASKLRIRAVIQHSQSGGGGSVYALFRDSTANAISATVVNANTTGSHSFTVVIDFEDTAGSTSATTYRIRGGGGYVNRTVSGATLGGVFRTSLEISEIRA